MTGTGEAPQSCCEGSFGAQPVGVVAGGDQQLSGDVDADAVLGEQAGRGGLDQCVEVVVGGGDLGVEVPAALGEPAQGEFGGLGRVGQVAAGAQCCSGLDQSGSAQPGELGV